MSSIYRSGRETVYYMNPLFGGENGSLYEHHVTRKENPSFPLPIGDGNGHYMHPLFGRGNGHYYYYYYYYYSYFVHDVDLFKKVCNSECNK